MTDSSHETSRAEDALFRAAQAVGEQEEVTEPSQAGSYWDTVRRLFFQNRAVAVCFFVMTVLLVFSLIQPFLPGQKDPNTIYNNPETGIQLINEKPNREFILGTNNLGQDLWARLWAGTRTSLFIALAAAVIRTFLGVAFGLIWGYSRAGEAVLTELYNVMDNIPSTIILLAISYLLRPGVGSMIFAMCVAGWTGTARLIRTQTVSLRDSAYNQASRCLGTPFPVILARNIAPRILPVVLLQIALAVPAGIGNEVLLSYLGLGLPDQYSSLGHLVNTGRKLIMSPSLGYQFFAPIVILGIITVCFYFIGQFLGDCVDPKSR